MSNGFIDRMLDSCKQNVVEYDLCEEALCLHNLTYIKIAQWLELIADFIAIISVLCLIRTEQFKKLGSIVNPSLKLIGITGLGFYCLGNISSLCLHIYLKILSFSTIHDSCSYLWTPIGCLAYRLPVYYAFVGFNTFHFMLSLERARLLFGRYSSDGILFGQVAVVIMLTLPVFFIVWTFYNDDFIKMRPYCLLYSSEKTIYSLMISGILLLVSDFLTTTLDVVIYCFNRRQLNSKMRGYNLSRTFRLKETQISMRLVFPFAIIHSTIYACFMALAVFSTYWVMGLDPHRAIPVLQLLGVTKALYLTGVPVLILLFRFNPSQKADEWLVKQDYSEIYFQQFKNQIR